MIDLDGFLDRVFWTDSLTEFLDRIVWTDLVDGLLDGILDGFCDDELGTKLLWEFHSISSGFFGPFPNSTPKLHRRMVADQ